MKNVEIKLRAHHGMCLAFFDGKGYSAGFTAHMARILEYLEQENPTVTVVAAWRNTPLRIGRAFPHGWQSASFPKESGAKSAAAVSGAASAKKKRLCTVCDFYGRINKR